MAGGEKGLHLIAGRGHDGRDCGGDENVRDEQRKICEAAALGEMDAHGVGGGGGFKADAEEHDLLAGILDGEIDGVERRVDNADIAAAALDLEEIAVRAGDAQHVAEGAEDDAGLGGDGEGFVNEFERRDADRTAGAVNHFDSGREHLVDAVLDDGVGLAAADFHDLPRARGDLGDLAGEGAGDFAVAEFGEVLHGFKAAELAGLGVVRSPVPKREGPGAPTELVEFVPVLEAGPGPPRELVDLDSQPQL